MKSYVYQALLKHQSVLEESDDKYCFVNLITSCKYTSHASDGNGFQFEHLVHRPCPVASSTVRICKVAEGANGQICLLIHSSRCYQQFLRDADDNESIITYILNPLPIKHSTKIVHRIYVSSTLDSNKRCAVIFFQWKIYPDVVI